MSDAFDLRSTGLPSGTMLLEASAGTGKTFTITGIVLRLLLEGRVERLSEILVVTFTVAATQELKTRIRKALQDGMHACLKSGDVADAFLADLGKTYGEAGARKLRRALQESDEMSVATIHSFCKRVLDEAAFSSATPFRIDFAADDLPIRADASRDAVRIVVQSRDSLTAAVAMRAGLLPDGLLRLHKTFTQHADTHLVPEPLPLEPTLEALRTALRELRVMAETDDLPVASLSALPWGADARKEAWGIQGAQLVAELKARLLDDAAPDFQWIAAFSTTKLEEELLKKGRPPLGHAFFGLCERTTEAVEDAAHSLRAELLREMDARIARDKRNTDRMSFGDLLHEVDAALRDDVRKQRTVASIRRRFRTAVIDEFQDTDPVQYRVFATCFENRALYLVGDPKQSIYGFRGADVHAYLEARHDAAATHTLGENHRSHPDLVRGVSHVFQGEGAFAEDGIAMPRVDAAKSREELALLGVPSQSMQFRCIDTSGLRSENKRTLLPVVARDVASEISRLLSDAGSQLMDRGAPRRLAPSDFAVLTRTNAEAQAVQNELRKRGVHSAIGRAGNVFECPEFDDIRCLLRALGQSQQLPLVRALWTTPIYDWSAADLASLDGDDAALQDELLAIEALRREWQKHGFLAMFQQLLAQTDARTRLLARPDGERKLTNYLQVAELLHHAEHEHRLRGDGLLHWMERLQRNANAIDEELKELRLESDAKAVRILTVHGSKGLQYEIVFVPFAWGGRGAPKKGTPVLARQDNGSFALDFDQGVDNVARYLHDELAENLRLLYVALTRARRRCVVHAVPSRESHRSALGYLLLGHGRTGAVPTEADLVTWRGDGKKDASDWRQGAHDLAATSDGAIEAILVAPRSGSSSVQGATTPRVPQRPRAVPTKINPGHRTTSYSQIIAMERVADDGETLASIRADDEADAVTPTTDVTTKSTPTGMFAFASGAAAGICLHGVFEHIDYCGDDDSLRAVVEDELRAAGLDRVGAHRAPIDPVDVTTANVRAVLDRPLPQFGFRLADVPATSRIPEWRFLASASHLVPQRLAEVFSTHGGPGFSGYARRLRTLPAHVIDGFLNGSIDLLCEHDGRYYVFDWKSNWLGDRAEDYSASALQACVEEQDYVLQYCLYLLAVHRHLDARLDDYDYDLHIGGVCYVFLRAIGSGDHDHGFHVSKPPRELIEALDAWLSAGNGGAA